jgi:hypothetical protein
MQTSTPTPPAESELDLSPEQRASTDLAKLIRKLRWIGMEEEAKQLQTVLSRFPSEQVEIVLADPPNTD